MRLPVEAVNLFQGDAVGNNATVTYRDIFPLGGEGWRKLRLTIHASVTHVDGANPTPHGLFNLIRGIRLHTSKNEDLIITPGLGLFYLNWLLNRVEPRHDAVPTSSIVAHAILDLPLSMNLLGRKEDLCLDSNRYSHIELEIQTGNPEHLYGAGSEGSNTVAITFDMDLIRGKSTFAQSGKPLAVPYIKHLPPWALTRGYMDIESAKDLTLFGFQALVQDMGAQTCYDPAIGRPYSGLPIDAMEDVTFRDNLISWLRNLDPGFFREERAHYAGLNLIDDIAGAGNYGLSGQYPWIFARDGSIYNAYYTGDRSEIRLENNPVALSGTTPQIDMVIFGMRTMRE